MALEWLRRENDLKDHQLIDNSHFGTEAPTVIYEERPVLDDKGAAVPACTRPGSGSTTRPSTTPTPPTWSRA
jgi:hypothetical protein